MRIGIIIGLGLAAAPALAATPAAWTAERRAAVKACVLAADLSQPTTAAPIAFSDTHAVDTILVSGRWKPAHMKRARATMLCLYDRRTRLAEVQEASGWTAPPVKPR